GAMGLGRPAPELGYWLAHGHRPTWERHLVWLLPALGFLVVISGLAWWGREFSKPSSPSRYEASSSAGGAREADSTTPAGGAGLPWPPSGGRPALERVNAPPAYPRTIPVSSNEDLPAILAAAPRRSVIVLADDGPYPMGGRAWPARAPAPLAHPELT